MAHNPYTPPAAVVEDAAPLSPVDPAGARDVLRACTIMWLSFGLSVITNVFEVLKSLGGPMAVVIGVIVGVAIALGIGALVTWWFTSRLRLGRHWMRMLLTVLAVLGIGATILFWNWYRAIVMPIYTANPGMGVLAAVQYVLWLGSLILLYTPRSNAWFAAMRKAR